ncbi:MAG: VOC family protein [Proteobacteria bacterium]|nr:MAG: VOC family protein [Pseudomonadota bacterium]
MTKVLINIDVDDILKAEMFYTKALDLKVGRRFADDFIELLGDSCVFYLLKKDEGSKIYPSAREGRSYARHWTPVHVDFVVDDIERTRAKLEREGAVFSEVSKIRTAPYGKIFECSDPFGHGLCVIQFLGRGYDELLTPQK